MLKENDQVKKSHFLKNMASTSNIVVEIRKFNRKKFDLWKEFWETIPSGWEPDKPEEEIGPDGSGRNLVGSSVN